jgi:hypothetical protein
LTITAASSRNPAAAVRRLPPPAAPPDVVVPPADVASLSATVLRTLTRECQAGYSTGAVRTLLLAVVSLGFLPVVTWTRRFRAFARFERQQLWHLAEWLRLHTGRPEAAALTGLAERARWQRAIGIAAFVVAAATFATVALTLWREPAAIDALVTAIRVDRSPARLARHGAAPLVALIAWNAGLSIVYALHWLQVRLHAVAVRRFVDGLNVVLAAERVEPVVAPPSGAGVHPAWLAVGAAGVVCGAVWALPMALAGGLQRRYINVWCPAIRAAVADRVRTMLQGQRPAVALPPWGGEALVCQELRCGAEIPAEARFCPRCGTGVAASPFGAL